MALTAAALRKSRTCPELVGPRARARLLVMGVEVGGRWAPETRTFLSLLARARGRGESRLLQRRAEQALAFEVEFFVVVYCRVGVREHIVGTPRSIRRRWGHSATPRSGARFGQSSCSEAPRASSCHCISVLLCSISCPQKKKRLSVEYRETSCERFTLVMHRLLLNAFEASLPLLSARGFTCWLLAARLSFHASSQAPTLAQDTHHHLWIRLLLAMLFSHGSWGPNPWLFHFLHGRLSHCVSSVNLLWSPPGHEPSHVSSSTSGHPPHSLTSMGSTGPLQNHWMLQVSGTHTGLSWW